jgi:hypothetical protein
VAPREDEAVAVQPFGGSRIVAKAACAVEYSTDIGTAEREAEVAQNCRHESHRSRGHELGSLLGREYLFA